MIHCKLLVQDLGQQARDVDVYGFWVVVDQDFCHSQQEDRLSSGNFHGVASGLPRPFSVSRAFNQVNNLASQAAGLVQEPRQVLSHSKLYVVLQYTTGNTPEISRDKAVAVCLVITGCLIEHHLPT